MPSDENGRSSSSHPTSPPSSGGPPPSSTSEPPPAELVAWGPVRDAITAIHNLETLLKSPRIGAKVLADVLPELWVGTGVLRSAFTNAAQGAKGEEARAARGRLVMFTLARLDELEHPMRASTSDLDTRARLSLEQVVTRVSVDLDACTELLDLAERAEHVLPTELALEELARVSMRGKPRGAEHGISVRLALDEDHCVLRADPHVFKRLVVFSVARVHAAGAAAVTIRIRCAADRASIEVGATTDAELVLPTMTMRLVRRIEPTDAIVDAAARDASIDEVVSGTSVVLSVPRVA
jgi:hypothetical protein